MGLLDMLRDVWYEITGGGYPEYEYEERKWARQERQLRKITSREEKALKPRRKAGRTNEQRKKHAAYMRKWRRERSRVGGS